jgi:hypothetical protein
VLLHFEPANAATQKLRAGLSSVVLHGNELWTVSDETASIERLMRIGSGREPQYGEHMSFALDSLLALPLASGAPGGETDIEALAIEDDHIWLVGSHGVNRNKPRGKSTAERIGAIAKTSATGNRHLIARIPLGLLRGDAGAHDARPPARVRGGARSDDLTRALRSDPHLGPYVALPGKENGFDIEGLAVAPNGRVFLGLRGPVLGGYAIVLELHLAASRSDPARLKLRRLADGAPRIRKHFLDLRGLGIRDLCRDGEDLLVLAGPTMTLDGPAALYRWTRALRSDGQRLMEGDRLLKLLDVPVGDGCDHPEGVALWPPARRHARTKRTSVLIVYERPAKTRVVGKSSMRAEIFRLPRVGRER